jgi:Flp pilus assembly protein TadG
MPPVANSSGAVARKYLGDGRGASAVEFALILPVLMLILFGTLKFSIALNRQVSLNAAVDAAARYISVCQGVCPSTGSTPGPTTQGPWLGAEYAMDTAAPTLNSTTLNSSLTITATSSSGSSDGACTSDTTCASALSQDLVNGSGGHVTVTATYPCDLKVMGVDFAPSCTMQAQTTAIIE